MRIIDRYLGINIISATLLVLLILVGLTIFVTLVKEISAIGTGAYGLTAALIYVLFDLPQEIYTFFPIAALLGVLIGLGILANHSELIILRASGISINKISWTVMKAAIVLLIAATLLGEGIAPIAEHSAQERKAMLTSGGQALLTGQGIWVRDGNNILNIQRVIGTNHLQGINRYQFDNQHNLISVSHAEKGRYQQGQWIMNNINVSYINPTHVESQHLTTDHWQLALDPKLLRISVVDPDEMSLKQLNDYINYLKENNLDTSSYSLSFWQRLLQPFATLIMVWLGIPFVFGSLRNITIGLRIILGLAVGFCFFILNGFFGPLSVFYQWPPFLAASMPLVIFAFAAYWLQRRVH